MQQKPSENGVQIDNLLTMALQQRSLERSKLQLVLLALLGAVSSITTLLSMFAPPCHVPAVLLISAAMLLFFCWHAAHSTGLHISMLLFLLCYVAVFIWQREQAACGMVCILNAGYQAIHMTDWSYFELPAGADPEYCTTLLLCLVLMPMLWLLGYAVIRFQNFLLSLLVTFPFVEIGFFFGIVPTHLPAFGLFGFWCGMAAVQIAGAGNARPNGKAGFQRRRNTFFPVTTMRFLLPEFSGVLTAVIVIAAAVLCDAALTAAHYERPYRVKQLRSDFQHYVASIDWSDLSSLVPDIFPEQPGDETDDKVDLGSSDQREFAEETVSRAYFTDIPEGRIYLRFAAYSQYSRSTWTRLPDDIQDPVFTSFDRLGLYPPEFLYYTAAPVSGRMIGMTLEHPNEVLSRCVPYGYAETELVTCSADDISRTAADRYTLFGGDNYEQLLQQCAYTQTTVGELLSHCPPEQAERLAPLTEGRTEATLCLPENGLGTGSMVLPDKRAEAAILSACGYEEFVREHYLGVPQSAAMDSVRAGYADLLDGFDAASADPAAVILEMQLLRERLCAQVSYSLAPGKTPPSRDFVSYFLLENRKGYCTHYATAAVLLCRMAGIPARYCEGYMLDAPPMPDTDSGGRPCYSIEILDSNAHAWCEVYLDGIGWIPFEFTYSYFTPPVFTQEEEPTEATEPVTEPIPVPTAAPEPVTPAETAAPTAAAPLPVPTEPAAPQGNPLRIVLPLLGGLLLIGTVLLGFIAARSYALRRRRRLLQDPARSAQTAWRYFLALLRECGADTDARTTADLADSAHAACGSYLSGAALDAALDAGKKLCYSPHGLNADELRTLIRTGRHLAAAYYRASGPLRRLRLKWIRHYL